MERSSQNASTLLGRFLYCGSILTLFVIIHFTQDRINWLVSITSPLAGLESFQPTSDLMRIYVPSLKGLAFLCSVSILLIPILKDMRNALRSIESKKIVQPVINAIVVTILLMILVFNPGSKSLGSDYAKISRNPFTTNSGLFNTRLLMPAFANVLFFRGNWLYYLFSIILTILFIALLYSWMKSNSPMPFWQFVSLCTSSFVIYQFQTPGYPDILVFVCFILAMQDITSYKSKLSLLILALATYESSLFVGVIFAWRYLQRKGFFAYVLALIGYVIVWYATTGFDLGIILASHNVSGTPGYEWFFRLPVQGLLGIFIGNKLLWVVLFWGMVLAWKLKNIRDFGFMTMTVLASLLMTALAVDTSRLIGFTFPALLVALSIITQYTPQRKQLLSILFLINLIIPSFNLGLNIDLLKSINWSSGLYERLYSWIPNIFVNAIAK